MLTVIKTIARLYTFIYKKALIRSINPEIFVNYKFRCFRYNIMKLSLLTTFNFYKKLYLELLYINVFGSLNYFHPLMQHVKKKEICHPLMCIIVIYYVTNRQRTKPLQCILYHYFSLVKLNSVYDIMYLPPNSQVLEVSLTRRD